MGRLASNIAHVDFVPCTAKAVKRILQESDVHMARKSAVVIGRSGIIVREKFPFLHSCLITYITRRVAAATGNADNDVSEQNEHDGDVVPQGYPEPA